MDWPQSSGLNPDDVDVHFIEGVFSIPEFAERIEQDVIALGGVDTIFVDTTAAYFPGTDENSNVEMGAYARLLRSLTRMECRPAVIAASHPIKNASEGNLLPRGGGAFLNEVDGNLALAKKGERTSELHWQGKFRGPEFARITFDLPEIRVPTLVDSRGRQIPTVMARTVSDGELSARAAAAMKEDQEMLIAIRANGKRSLRDLAEFLKWGDDDAAKRKAQTVTDRLKKAQMIQYDLGVWSLTKKGEQAAPEAARVLHAENAARQSAANVVCQAGGTYVGRTCPRALRYGLIKTLYKTIVCVRTPCRTHKHKTKYYDGVCVLHTPVIGRKSNRTYPLFLWGARCTVRRAIGQGPSIPPATPLRDLAPQGGLSRVQNQNPNTGKCAAGSRPRQDR